MIAAAATGIEELDGPVVAIEFGRRN